MGGGSEIYILGKSFEMYPMSNNINEKQKQKKQKYKGKYKIVYIVDRLVYNLTLYEIVPMSAEMLKRGEVGDGSMDILETTCEYHATIPEPGEVLLH